MIALPPSVIDLFSTRACVVVCADLGALVIGSLLACTQHECIAFVVTQHPYAFLILVWPLHACRLVSLGFVPTDLRRGGPGEEGEASATWNEMRATGRKAKRRPLMCSLLVYLDVLAWWLFADIHAVLSLRGCGRWAPPATAGEEIGRERDRDTPSGTSKHSTQTHMHTHTTPLSSSLSLFAPHPPTIATKKQKRILFLPRDHSCHTTRFNLHSTRLCHRHHSTVPSSRGRTLQQCPQPSEHDLYLKLYPPPPRRSLPSAPPRGGTGSSHQQAARTRWDTLELRWHSAYHMDGTSIFAVAARSERTPSRTWLLRVVGIRRAHLPLHLRRLTLSPPQVVRYSAGIKGLLGFPTDSVLVLDTNALRSMPRHEAEGKRT